MNCNKESKDFTDFLYSEDWWEYYSQSKKENWEYEPENECYDLSPTEEMKKNKELCSFLYQNPKYKEYGFWKWEGYTSGYWKRSFLDVEWVTVDEKLNIYAFEYSPRSSIVAIGESLDKVLCITIEAHLGEYRNTIAGSIDEETFKSSGKLLITDQYSDCFI